MSRSSLGFLTRQRIIEPTIQHMPKLSRCGQASHERVIKPARFLLGPDVVVERVRTEKEENRQVIKCPDKLPPISTPC